MVLIRAISVPEDIISARWSNQRLVISIGRYQPVASHPPSFRADDSYRPLQCERMSGFRSASSTLSNGVSEGRQGAWSNRFPQQAWGGFGSITPAGRWNMWSMRSLARLWRESIGENIKIVSSLEWFDYYICIPYMAPWRLKLRMY